jgi:hypothetical protein
MPAVSLLSNDTLPEHLAGVTAPALLTAGFVLVALHGGRAMLDRRRVAGRSRCRGDGAGHRPWAGWCHRSRHRRLRSDGPQALGWVTAALALLGLTTAAQPAAAQTSPGPETESSGATGSIAPDAAEAGVGVAVMRIDPDAPEPTTSLPLAAASPASAAAPAEPEPDPATPAPPSATATPPAGAPSGARPGDAAPPTATGSPGQHIAAPGDHLWGIAEQELARRLGRPPTDDEVAPYWRAVIDANRDRLAVPGDPDLILPGQVIVLPG